MKAKDITAKYHDFVEPRLILAIKVREAPGNFELDDRREWHRILHQTSGHACGTLDVICTFLEPHPNVSVVMNEIDRTWYDTDLGAWSTPLNDVIKYRQILNEKLGVDCNRSYDELEEAVYPIDCSPENLKKLCVDDLPEDLESLLKFDRDLDRMMGMINRWKIYIIGENCD